jgi:hypothetical protein
MLEKFVKYKFFQILCLIDELKPLTDLNHDSGPQPIS